MNNKNEKNLHFDGTYENAYIMHVVYYVIGVKKNSKI